MYYIFNLRILESLHFSLYDDGISICHTHTDIPLTDSQLKPLPAQGVTASLISPHVGTLVIKSLAEAPFVSPSVVAIATTAASEPITTTTMSPKTPASSTSESSSSITAVTATKASVATITGLLLFKLWELCSYT